MAAQDPIQPAAPECCLPFCYELLTKLFCCCNRRKPKPGNEVVITLRPLDPTNAVNMPLSNSGLIMDSHTGGVTRVHDSIAPGGWISAAVTDSVVDNREPADKNDLRDKLASALLYRPGSLVKDEHGQWREPSELDEKSEREGDKSI